MNRNARAAFSVARAAFKWAANIIQWHSSVITVALLPIIYYCMQWVIYIFFPTASQLDPVYFTYPLVASFMVLTCHSFAMLGMKFTQRPLYEYYRLKISIAKNRVIGEKTQYHSDIHELYKQDICKRLHYFWRWYATYFVAAILLTSLLLLHL
jgi:hypothetical protein